jgi:hypothetical protein
MFQGHMYVSKDELDYFVEKFAKVIQIFLSEKRSDPDPEQLFRNRMRPDQKVPGPDPKHWF